MNIKFMAQIMKWDKSCVYDDDGGSCSMAVYYCYFNCALEGFQQNPFRSPPQNKMPPS